MEEGGRREEKRRQSMQRLEHEFIGAVTDCV